MKEMREMEVTWILNNGERRVILTTNSFSEAMRCLERASDGDFVRINDPRFDEGNAEFIKKSEILGWRCPETAILRHLKAKNAKNGQGSDEK